MIHHGDLFDVLPTLDAESVEACVCDPPYGLGFMAKDWDVPGGIGAFPMRRRVETDAVNTGASRQGGRQRSCVDFQKRQNRDAQAMQAEAESWAREVFRVLKPGAHLVACGGTRMYHRLTVGIEDAGFEIRDCLSWLYGSGFPKSLNVGEGRGTALKPAWEPIVLARKPTVGTVAANVQRHSTGALNIDACRIGEATDTRRSKGEMGSSSFPHSDDAWKPHLAVGGQCDLGRWPANVVLDEDTAAMLDEQTGDLSVCESYIRAVDGYGANAFGPSIGESAGMLSHGIGDRGGASRFYYCAKPSREERDYGCEQLPPRRVRPDGAAFGEQTMWNGQNGDEAWRAKNPNHPARNFHPTVKPIALMRWLVKLVTPIGGTVLDPFMGSGTTGMACRYEQRGFIGIEREAEYVAIAERRIAAVAPLFAEIA